MTISISGSRQSALQANGIEDNAFVAWDNLAVGANFLGSATIVGGEAANSVTGSTYDRWRPNPVSPFYTLTFDMLGDKTISFVAIAAHNVSNFVGLVDLQHSVDGSSWVNSMAPGVTPVDNSPIIWRFDPLSRRYWRFFVGNLTVGDPVSIGVAFFGNELVIPSRVYQGFSPILTATEVQLQSNVSVGNELIGSSVVGRGSSLEVDFNLLPSSFVRSQSWLSFQRHFNEGGGFFMGWRPQKYPQDVYYAWRKGSVLRPYNSGPKDYMSVNLSAQVHHG